MLAGKGKALAVIAELERLVPLLKEAVREETAAAVSSALAEEAAKQEAAKREEEQKGEAVTPETSGEDQLTTDRQAESAEVTADSLTSETLALAVNDAIERLVQLAYFTQV